MKNAAFILSLLMLFSTVQPLLIECQVNAKAGAEQITSCCGGKSCDKKEKNKKEPAKDCDKTNACNPFAGCSSCQYTAVSKFLYEAHPVSVGLIKPVIGSENIETGVNDDCFHPPENRL